MSMFNGMQMPREMITQADIVIGKGKVLKNRKGDNITFDGILTPEIEIAIRDGKVIWTNIKVAE